MTLARRLAALVQLDERGRPKQPYSRGGLDVPFVEAIAGYLVQDGVDEVWLKTASDIKLLFEPLATLEKRVFAPLVAWGPVASVADARLLLSFGADRVVVDCNRGLPDPLSFIERIVEAAGADRVTVAVHTRRVVTDKGIVFELVTPSGEGAEVSALTLIDMLQQTGVAEIVLVPTKGSLEQDRVHHDGELIEKAQTTLHVPLLSHAEDKETADLATPLLMGADGIVSSLLATTAIDTVRKTLLDYGLALRS